MQKHLSALYEFVFYFLRLTMKDEVSFWSEMECYKVLLSAFPQNCSILLNLSMLKFLIS